MTSWNALAISAFVNAYRSFGEKAFLEKALVAANFIKTQNITSDGKVFRMVKKSSTIPGFLDDYSLLAQAFIDLYRATFNEEWLRLSKQITNYSIRQFFDEETGMFYYSELDEGGVITRKTEISDNVIPASNSVMAKVLYQLAIYFEEDDYLKTAEKMLNNTLPQAEENGAYYSNWASLLCNFVYQPPEVVFTGEGARKMRIDFDKMFTYALVAGSVKESKIPLLENRVIENESLIYVCRNRVCKLPVKSVKEAMEQF